MTAQGLRDTGGSETGLRIEIHQPAGWVLVTLIGEVDLDEAHRVAQSLSGAVAAAGDGVVVDLRGATFLGSTGVRMLIDAEVAASARGLPLKVAAGAGPARRTLELVGLAERLGLVDDLD